MNNQELTTEERQALIGFCKTTMRLKDSEGMGYKLAEFALAALTAEPKEISKDIIREIFMRNGFTIKDGQSDLKDYVYASAYELLRLSAIDNTAQQYEALAGWKMVPIEPTAAMYDAGDKQLATKQVWDAMLAAAPKPEV